MNNIFDAIKNRNILLASHRGVNGGNIPCNSLQGYQIAINQGADIIELDISVSKDRKLYLHHPGMEWLHLGKHINLSEMDSSEIKGIKLANQDGCETQYPLATLEDVLKMLKGKCFINVDKFWGAPEEISKEIRKYDMADQCIVKSFANENTANILKEYAQGMHYMAMVRNKDQVYSNLFDKDINFVGLELLFSKDTDEIATKEFIDDLHNKGMIAWGNSIVYNYKDVIAADHTDDVALLGNPEHGWAWFSKQGFDIIQTDWLMQCSQYLISKGLRR